MITRFAAQWRRLRQFFSRGEWSARWLHLPRRPFDSEAHGLVMVQIDGLSRAELERAISTGKLPLLKRLIDREHYRTHSFYSGLPSSTPSVQGELFYGQKCAVPAFGFRDHRSKKIVRMFSREIAVDVQRRLAEQGQGLLTGGSAYCNVYDGGAAESHFCASSFGWDTIVQSAKSWRILLVATFYVGSLLRIFSLLLVECLLAAIDFLFGFSWREFWQELMMIPARVVVVILMRELAINGAVVDTARGLPIIHLNLLGFDEQAHRRQPDSGFAHWTLKGIDAAIKRLWDAAHRSQARHYDVWVYSDHGQETTVPYEYESGTSLQVAVEQASAAVLGELAGMSHEVEEIAVGYGDRAQWLSAGWLAAKLFGEDTMTGSLAGSTPQVAALGPLGHVYLNRETTSEQRISIARRLVQEHQVPLVCVVAEHRGVLAITRDRTFTFPDQADDFFAQHPFSKEVADDLVLLCRHPDAGEIVVSGWNGTSPSISFVRQNGAHAGPGTSETHAFALLPCDTPVKVRAGNYIRPVDLRHAASQFLRQTEPVRPALTARAGNTFRVMTYNVHACVGMDGKLSPRRIARVIAQSGADIVALQELDVGRSRTNHDDQAHEIARYLEMEFEFHPAWQLEEEQYGDAILSRFPMRSVKAGELPFARASRERRGAIWVELELPDGHRLQMINTHLSIYPKEQLLQSQALLTDGWLDDAWNHGPVILIGDFNAGPTSASYQLLQRRMHDIETNRRAPNNLRKQPSTWPSTKPLLRIDHIFTSIGDFCVQDVNVIGTAKANLASDHLPLMAQIQVSGSANGSVD